jgi:two-component system OmpR family sensor kinase
VRVGLRPLEGIGETAGAIAAGDLSRRVEPADERTEVGRLGRSLNAMLAQIEAAFEERRASESRLRRFVADASHELRTPLTSIRGYAELFRRGADTRPEDLEKSMARIEAEASRMGVLVDDLLLLARLDQGRPLEREPVDLHAVVTEAVESARAIDPDRPVDLAIDDDVRLVGDEARLRQVLDNLLENARIHTPDGTPVHVRVGMDGTHVVISVRDEGPGLSAEDTTKAFERFYRGDPVRSRTTGGSGLGLSIAAAIVDAHGGTTIAASHEGSGATFEVRIPAGLDPATDG